ncbi:MAG: glycosyltransferase family 2 protein [Nitrospirae bacterium]|nr:glycosyltransferase family 2 protein [Nitrospirota bacterium]
MSLKDISDYPSRANIKSERYISIIIPNYNKADTIGKCLEAVLSSRYGNFEVVVVDDHSEDNSVEIIKRFPCKLIRLEGHEGTSRARNIGALNSNGEVLFFIDADCLLKEDTLSIINRTLSTTDSNIIIGGTYTRMPYDEGFFSLFQSVFINYSETKKARNPNYIAAHAMVIDAQTFRKSGGFSEGFLPILEDVEFSHRLQRKGYRLLMNPEIQVQHIFNFSLAKSLQNAIKKSMYWTMYSLKNRDLFSDSGTASVELKVNGVSYFFSLLFLIFWIFLQKSLFLFSLPLILAFNTFINRGLLKAFYETNGIFFAVLAYLYYTMLYPLPVGTGVIAGAIRFLFKKGIFK